MFKLFFLASLVTLSSASFAGVEAYSGTGGQKLIIEEASGLGSDMYLVRMSGIYPEWDNKIIPTKKRSGSVAKYEFDYEEELSSGKIKKTYGLVTEARDTLVNGTIVKQVTVWTPNKMKDGTTLSWDKDLTASSQHVNLAEEHKKKPYKPTVE